MNAQEFVSLWKTEKEDMLTLYINGNEETEVSSLIKSMNLSKEQMVKMNKIVDTILTDTFYGLLLGLDGEAQIGGVQETYKIHDSSGDLISECGDLEAEAWELFHGDN